MGFDDAPSVTLRAESEEIAEFASAKLAWESSNASVCFADGAWSGQRATSGSFVTSPLAQDETFRLSCEGPEGTAVAMVTVRTESAAIRWQAASHRFETARRACAAGPEKS